MKTFRQFLEEAQQLNERAYELAEAVSDKDHAAAIRRGADKHLKRMLKDAGDSKKDQKSAHSIHKDLHKVADHVAKGNHKKAYAHMQTLDTSTKDQIPQRAYNHITKHGYDGKD